MHQRMPFHYGLFYNAMIGFLGREPDHATRLGWDGFYEFRYLPKNQEEARKLEKAASTLAQWLDLFEITFSRSRCEFGIPSPRAKGDQDQLQIRIAHPVEPEKKS